jgi:GrpB-like predicted nucleotidyltransferase (UPF0157 family)
VEDNKNPDNWPVWATEPVEVNEPDPFWQEQGDIEKNHLYELLSPVGLNDIEHIGSTSIPNLPAKPIIDLMALVRTFNQIDEIEKILSPHDWNYVPPELDGHSWRRFFVKVRDDKRIAHLHLMVTGEERWDDQLLFRDALRNHPLWAEDYANLKRELSKKYKNDREAYTEEKTQFVNKVLDQMGRLKP